jgi:hypothetical protein
MASAITVGPFLPGTSTGTISSANAPDAWAASARWWERNANSSWASRLTLCFIATRSAWMPMWTSQALHHRPSYTVASMSSWLPSR